MSWIAVGVIGAGALGAMGSEGAASIQADAALQAAGMQESMFNTQMANQAPFREAGAGAQANLNYLLGIGTPGQYTGSTPGQGGQPGANNAPAGGGFGSLLSPFTMDTFRQFSPAYQFQKQQGTQGVLNADASGSGALSGAAMKDLIGFNQGLANTAFDNAFNQYQTQQGNIYARLAGVAQLGQAAASNQATGASNFGASIGQNVANAGTARAGGIVGATNSLGSIGALPWLQSGAGGAGLYSSGSGAGYTQAGGYITPTSSFIQAPE